MANQNFNWRPNWLTATLGVAIGLALASAMVLAPKPVQAVHVAPAPFELEGNAIKETLLDDWDSVFAPIVGGVPTTGDGETFVEDGPNAPGGKETTAWEGSNKDIDTIDTWARKTAKVNPDKDNITNAYAKAYSVDHDGDGGDDPGDTPNHLVIYFGADRFANNGDAALGFWFFAGDVGLDNGSFTGQHTDNDVLVQVDFVQGGSKSEVQIFRWKGDGTGSHGTLDEIAFASSSGFVVCTDGDTACAVTNQGDETAPWSYTPKSGVAGTFPHESFYEGGIDVTALIGEVCFSAFMAETRSSHSETAELKDFALGDFDLCEITVTKACSAGPVIGGGGTFLTSTFEVTVTNSGFGPVYNTAFEEDIDIPGGLNDENPSACRLTSPVVDNDLDKDELKEILAGELASGDSVTATVECDHSSSKLFNNVTARASASPGGSRDVVDSYPMVAEDTCELLINPMIDVLKECKTVTIEVQDGVLQPRVCNKITLTNNSTEKLNDVNVIDTPDNAPAQNLLTGGDLDPGEIVVFDDVCYTPIATDNGTIEPEEAQFTNTVMAEGTGAISQITATDDDTIPCKLCPPPQSEESVH